MGTAWQIVPLGDFITQRKEFITIDDLNQYKRARVQLHGKGIVLRDELFGAVIKTKEQQVAREGEFLVAEIDAKVGGFGIVPPELDGAIVSSHYFQFQINEKKCLRQWLDWFIRSGLLEEQVVARGSTNYSAIRPIHVMKFGIPLPPLAEQSRIVERIEALASRVTAAQSLRKETIKDADNLLIVMAQRLDKNRENLLQGGWVETYLKDIIYEAKERCPVKPNTDYPNLGIFSFARGLFHKQPINGNLTSAKELYRVHKGQFIYSRLFAFEGACGIISDEYDGCYVSNEYPTFNCDPSKVKPEFLFAYFKSMSIWKEISAGSKGLGDRRQRVQPSKFLEHKLLLPPLYWQSTIVEVMQMVSTLRAKQAETEREISALLPSVLDRAFKGEL